MMARRAKRTTHLKGSHSLCTSSRLWQVSDGLVLLMVPWVIYLSYLITSTIWCGTHNRVSLQFKCVLADNPLSPGEVGHTTGVYVPYSFRTVVWVLLRPTRTDQWKCCETGPTVFRPYPRRLESLTICRCHCKGSTFSSVILKTLSFGLARVWTRDLTLSRPALSQLI